MTLVTHHRFFKAMTRALLAAALTLSATAHAERTYLYEESDGTVWYTNVKPQAQDSSRYRLLEIRGRAAAVVSCRGISNQIMDQRASRFSDTINRYAKLNKLDSRLISAVIQTESCFDEWAISSAGAQGLMQLMPATAQWLGVENPFIPEQNLEAGTRYLSDLLKQFDNNLQLALAAYNAGPGAVRKHGGIPPYPETQKYVKKVLKLYRGNLAQIR